MSGSYAYVAARFSNSLVVVDISNPASPVIRGSVVSSSLNNVRAARSCGRGWPRAPRHASAPSITLARPRRHRPLMPSRALTSSLSRAVHTGGLRGRERLVRLRDGVYYPRAGGGRREQPCVSSHSGQCGLLVPSGAGARAASGALHARMASGAALASAPSIMLASAAPPPLLELSRALTCSL